MKLDISLCAMSSTDIKRSFTSKKENITYKQSVGKMFT